MGLTRIAVLVSAFAMGALAVGFAAGLSVGGGTLGMDSEITPRCTSAGLRVLQNVSGTTVVSVTVSSLPAACGGATLQVTVNNQLTSSSGSAAVPAEGGSVTVTFALAVAITAIEQVDLVLTGP